MTQINHFPFHIGDFLSGCLHMDTLEKGAYVMLLVAHYQAGESGLPDDQKKLARIAGLTGKKWAAIRETVMEKFELQDGGWVNCRVLSELKKIRDISASQRAKALKRHDSDHAAAVPEQCQPIAKSQEPIEKKENPSSVPPSVGPKPASPKATRLSRDWELSVELGDWGMAQGLSRAEVLAEEQKFLDYWTSKGGKDATKADWEATWRNWVRNAIEYKNERKVRK